MALQNEIENGEIAHYLGHNFDEFSDVIYIMTDWYRPYQMVGEFEGVDPYQYVARQFGKWLADNENEYFTMDKTQIAFFSEVIKSYKANLKRANGS